MLPNQLDSWQNNKITNNHNIYLDNNATTPMVDEVIAKMLEFATFPLNQSAVHQYGRTAQRLSYNSKMAISNLLNANHYQITFTSGATEASNVIINGVINLFNIKTIFCSKIEHDAVFKVAKNFADSNKISFIEIDVNDDGVIDIDDFTNKINIFTATKNHQAKNHQESNGNRFLVLAMLANNETGAIQPVKEIAKITHRNGGMIYSDIVQAVGKTSVDLEDLNLDFASISAHKFYGPQGIGAIISRKGLDFEPLFFGGGQENFKRPGTQNQLSIIGFGVAANLAERFIKSMPQIADCRNYFEDQLQKHISCNDLKIFSKNVNRLDNTSYIAISNCNSQNLVIACDLAGISISSGSACSSGNVNSSRILQAMKVENKFLNSAIRISLGINNTKQQIDFLVNQLLKHYQSNNS
jgi:cysteine desulfurase